MAAKQYDVLIIGSGHSGGMAAYILARKGISCLMLNAGPSVDLDRDRKPLPAHELPYRGLAEPGAVGDGAIGEYQLNGFVHPAEVPYTYDPDKPYVWVRSRLLGGRSIFWSRQSFRLSDLEFKARDHDGYGENWPVSLADLAPYYERVEEMYRVSGRPEGLPQFPDSKFTTVNKAPDSELVRHLTPFAKQRGMTLTTNRSSLGVNGMASSINLMLPDALASGNLTIVPNAVVHEIKVDTKSGLAGEVHFIERHTHRQLSAKGRVVVLAAGCLESTRLLLNSGIANSSGVLGHYLFDQFYGGTAYAAIPETFAKSAQGAFVAPFRNVSASTRAKNFIRRYVMNVGGGGNPAPELLASYGTELDEKLRQYGGLIAQGGLMGETLPRFENHVRINKNVKDAWGIPVLHIEASYGENERNLHQDAQDSAGELYEAAGFKVLGKNPSHRQPGQSVHELGTCRMGENPRSSVLNKWNQSHDMKNLFVVDGSSFVTGGWQNPTLTISALSMRASEYLAEQLRQRNL
jgi:choline dehydrogenase-like flavoprotein